jgi:hypothetical protein
MEKTFSDSIPTEENNLSIDNISSSFLVTSNEYTSPEIDKLSWTEAVVHILQHPSPSLQDSVTSSIISTHSISDRWSRLASKLVSDGRNDPAVMKEIIDIKESKALKNAIMNGLSGMCTRVLLVVQNRRLQVPLLLLRLLIRIPTN